MDSVDYEKVVADLENRRAAFNASIDSAIQHIKAIVAAGAGSATASVTADVKSASVSNGGHLTPDMLFGKSIPEAAIICLQTFKKPMSPREVADALESASFHHRSKNFTNTVNSVLNRRAESVRDVVKVGRNWALADWYPGRRKTSLRTAGHEVVRDSHDSEGAAGDDGAGV